MRRFLRDNKIFLLAIVSFSLLGLMLGVSVQAVGETCGDTGEGTCTAPASCIAADLITPLGSGLGISCVPVDEVCCSAVASVVTTECETKYTGGTCTSGSCVNGYTEPLGPFPTPLCPDPAQPVCCVPIPPPATTACSGTINSVVADGICQSADCSAGNAITDAIQCTDVADNKCCKTSSATPPAADCGVAGGSCQPGPECPTATPTLVTTPLTSPCTTGICCKRDDGDPAAGDGNNPSGTSEPSGEAGAFAKVVSWFLSLLIQLGGALLLAVVELVVAVSQFNSIINSYFVVQGWIVLRDLVNMFFVLGLLFIAFVTVLKIERYQWQKLLPKLLIMAVVVNFSRTICGLIIDFFQVMMFTFVNAYKDIAGENVFKGFGLRDMWDPITKVSAEGAELGSMTMIAGRLLGLIYVIVALIVFIIFLIILVFRIVALWVLVVFSPLAFFSAAFSGISAKVGSYWTKWFSMFIEYCMVGPLLAFFLWLSILSVASDYTTQYAQDMSPADTSSQGQASLSNAVTNNKAGRLDFMMKYVLGILMLVAGLKFTSEMKVMGASYAGKAASKLQDATMGRAERMAAWTGRAPGKAVKGGAGLAIAGAGIAGGFAYKQYVQPRIRGAAEDISKAWQTKTSLGDFGRKVATGARDRFSASEAPILRKLGQVLGGTPVELPEAEGKVGKAMRIPFLGDAMITIKTLFNETAFTKGQNEYIRKRTQASAAANISKDYKPLREVDSKRSEEILNMLPIDKENQDQVKKFLDDFLKKNKGKKLDNAQQRLVEGLFAEETKLGISTEDRYNQMIDAGFMSDASNLEQRMFEKKMEENERKSRGWNNSLSGDIYNPDTKQQEDYSAVRDGIRAAIKASGLDPQKARDALLQIDFDELKRNADGTFDTSGLNGDQKKLVDTANTSGVNSNMFNGVARSTEFQKKKEQEIASNIKAGGKDKFVALNNDRNYGNIFYYGLNNMDPVMSAAAEQKQYSAFVPKPIRDRNLVIDEFVNAKDNNIRLEKLQKYPNELAAIIESLEQKLNKKVANMNTADLDGLSELQALDTRNGRRDPDNAGARAAKAVAFTSIFDADNRLEEKGEGSEIMQDQLEAARSREGLGVKVKKAITDAIPNLPPVTADTLAQDVDSALDPIIKMAKDQQTRLASIGSIISSKLAGIGVSLGGDEINKLASTLESNTPAIKKRLKAMNEGYKEFGSHLKELWDDLGKCVTSGNPPDADHAALLDNLQQAFVNGLKKYAQKNGLDESRFNVAEVQSRLQQMLGTEPNADIQVNINSYISKLNDLMAQKKAATKSNDIKDINTQIAKLNDAWKGIYSDLQDFGFKA